ncbi:Fc.00g093240.m01.CDS01 [Cosmosporella sp. VM-42]
MATSAGNGMPDRIVPMRVVVCGVHRTGTLSMRSALYQLGFSDCYHMHTLINDPSRAPQWVSAFEAKFAGKGTFERKDWDRLLGDCQSVCDLPSAVVATEIALAYPEAKVVILNRDPEAWYSSVLHTIYPITRPRKIGIFLQMLFCVIFDDGMRNMAAYGRALHDLALPYDHGKEKDKAMAWYKDQYAEYRERIPAERYIEYNIKDGWKPLCEHLGVPVPTIEDEETGKMVEAPFPRLNDREAFLQQAVKIRAKSTEQAFDNLLKLVGKAAITGAVTYGGYLIWRSRLCGRL